MGCFFIKALSPKIRDTCRIGYRKTLKTKVTVESKDTVFSSHNIYKLTKTKEAHTYTYSIRCVLVVRDRIECGILTLSKSDQSAIITCQERENQFSPWSLTMNISHTSGYVHAQDQLANTKELNGIFCRHFLPF